MFPYNQLKVSLRVREVSEQKNLHYVYCTQNVNELTDFINFR